ncbi:hypothetical protein C8F04DRAFT_1012484 [Mycena alexandri]|uniref:Rad60/SUMO-like domain-containing protein n=1 Tax=Mycena alexandri TaxID=1745969 RepID=A0AAD6S8N8_9AGAR|nr:hypothetical protein C8F04DRAFT_1012484 [Mycena alexandri]
MASTTAPNRPRPRPKPRVKPVDEPSSSNANGSSASVPVVVDDDAMFLRNQGRSQQTWKKLETINKVVPKHKAARSDSDGDSDSPRPKKQKKKMSGGDTAQAKIARLQSETISSDSDSDSDISVLGGASSTPKTKRKRRSRSRSITPPPPVSKQTHQLTKAIVRKTLDAKQEQQRTPSPPPDFDESNDTIILDPELQQIMHMAAARASRSHSEPAESDVDQVVDTLEITVKWRPHPLNEAGKETEAIFKLNRTDNFSELFEAVAEDESILVESLVMSYKSVQVYPSVTPAALDLWEDAELTACDKTTWEYLRAHPAAAAANPAPSMDVSDSEDDDDAAAASPTSNTQESDAESDAGGETFKLVLQSGVTKAITLTVRPTTTCGAIVQAFLKKAGIADKYGGTKTPRQSLGGKGKGKKAAAAAPEKIPQLMIDGDKLAAHVPIGDMDLDDGDTVDVVGL